MFVVWLIAFPFICWWGIYEGIKIWWLWMGGILLAISWVWRLWNKNAVPEHTRFLVFITVLIVASFFGIHPANSLIGGDYRHQGVLFFFALYLIGETLALFDANKRIVLERVLTISVAVESGIVVVQKILDWASRPIGTIGEPNAVSGFLALGLFWQYRRRLFLPAAVVWLGILATGSRAGIVAAALVTMGAIRRPGIRFGVFIAACTVVAVFTFYRPVSLYENRGVFWKLGINAVVARPILGYGAESTAQVYADQFLDAHIDLGDFQVDRSHNIFLDVAIWSGFAGLAVFAWWLMGVWRNQNIRWPLAAWVAFACLQPVGVVHWILLCVITSSMSRVSNKAKAV